jgi:DNA polymerase-3 subunit epsilon
MAKRLVYYDTETTGVKAEKDRIIEIAAYDPLLDKSFVSFINPQMPIPAESTQICGITDEMVKDAPSFKEVGEQFFAFCGEDAVLVAHNNDSFDVHFLREECKRSGIALPTYQYIDTLKWARKYRPDLPRHSLQYLREVFGIEKNTAHRALDDVIMLHTIFSIMIDNLSVDEILSCLEAKSSSSSLQMPFGKHRGTPLSQLPKGYVSWLGKSGALDKKENESLKESLEKLGMLA